MIRDVQKIRDEAKQANQTIQDVTRALARRAKDSGGDLAWLALVFAAVDAFLGLVPDMPKAGWEARHAGGERGPFARRLHWVISGLMEFLERCEMEERENESGQMRRYFVPAQAWLERVCPEPSRQTRRQMAAATKEQKIVDYLDQHPAVLARALTPDLLQRVLELATRPPDTGRNGHGEEDAGTTPLFPEHG